LSDTAFDRLERLLAVRQHREFSSEGLPAASVAVVLREGSQGPELLLIRRAERAGDPWSGHMALPGGRQDPGDADAEAAAARETLEEVGIDVRRGRLLGRLDQVRPVSRRAPKILVSPFVYAVANDQGAVPNPEVALALWVPVAELGSPAAVTEFLYELEDGTRISFPAYGAGEHVIWGLTYRILTGFIRAYHDAVGHPEA
jgi:8-oxo-dGTP pyrophosphatase MutT (NUDIX family)